VRGHDYEKGDVIWLVSMLSGGSVHMPPAIDARIQVASKQTLEPTTGAASGKSGGGRYRYIADPAGSRFFTWADASGLVAECPLSVVFCPFYVVTPKKAARRGDSPQGLMYDNVLYPNVVLPSDRVQRHRKRPESPRHRAGGTRSRYSRRCVLPAQGRAGLRQRGRPTRPCPHRTCQSSFCSNGQ
jgi:hypothetical protein